MHTVNFFGSILMQINESSEKQLRSYVRLCTHYNIGAAVYKYAMNFILPKAYNTNFMVINCGCMVRSGATSQKVVGSIPNGDQWDLSLT
jgi:hypothetical protein